MKGIVGAALLCIALLGVASHGRAAAARRLADPRLHLDSPVFSAREYCAAAGTDDRLVALTHDLLGAARNAFYPSGGSDAVVEAETSFRCMRGRVWICAVGANLVCDKGDRDPLPPQVVRFCRRSADNVEAPMAVTGHATIFSWRCVGGRPALERSQTRKLDRRGFLADNWVEVK